MFGRVGGEESADADIGAFGGKVCHDTERRVVVLTLPVWAVTCWRL
jgi:hypothetical protein